MIKSALIEPAAPVDRVERTPPTGMKLHPLCELFPDMGDAAFAELREDIRKNGVIEPIVFLGDAILDGRNRYHAARELGIEYPRVEFTGADPLAFVLAKNLARRHLTESQRGMVAAKLAKLPSHRPEKGANLHPSAEQAGALLNVSERTVKTAKSVQDKGAPELAAAVEKGQVSVSAAAAVATLPKDQQSAVVAKGDKEILAEAKRIKDRQKAERQKQKAETDSRVEANRASLPDHVKQHEARKHQASQAKSTETPADAADTTGMQEAVVALEAKVETLTAEIRLFDEMKAQYEQGGFDAVVAGRDEQIRVLKGQVESQSKRADTWMKSAKFWEAEAKKLGWSRDEVIDIETGEVVDA